MQNTLQAMMYGESGVGVGTSSNAIDIGSYYLAAVIDGIERPGTNILQTVPITGFTNNGGGSYTVSWSPEPSGTVSLRGKWGTKNLTDWIGYDPVGNSFSASACTNAAIGLTSSQCSGDPTTTQPWFASTEITNMPAPGVGTVTVTGLSSSSLTATNFMIKAAAPTTSNNNPNLIDSTLSAESVSVLVARFRNKPNTTLSGENTKRFIAVARTTSNTTLSGENLASRLQVFRSTSDTTFLSEVVSSSTHSFPGGATLSENITIAEGVATGSSFLRVMSESTLSTETVATAYGYSRFLSESVIVSEGLVREADYFRSESKSLDINDSLFAFRQGIDNFSDASEILALGERVDINIKVWQPNLTKGHIAHHQKPIRTVSIKINK